MRDSTMKRWWPHGWWRIMEMRVGIVPLPAHLVLLAVIAYFAATGPVPTDLLTMVAVLGVLSFTCAELGHRIPVVNQIGGAAIAATFIPSFLTYHRWIPSTLSEAITGFTKSSNLLFLFISAIIVGSILGMDRHILIRGFLKLFVPMAAGTLAALGVGTAVGTLFGLGARHTLLMIVIPVMAGGVGEGAIPLSIGYGQIWHQPQGPLFAQVLPPVMFGSLTAILIAGALSWYGQKRPRLTGYGRLQPGESEDLATHADDAPIHTDVTHLASATMFIVTLYLLGVVSFRLWHFPAPITMLVLAVLAQLFQVVPPALRHGAKTVYQFFGRVVTYPLLFAIGVAMTPWNQLVAAFAPANLVTIVATVVTLIGTGYFVGRRIGLYPIDSAIVIACRAGQGGTGDVAILTAAERMALMPFAQIATRIGGAITVTLTLLALAARL